MTDWVYKVKPYYFNLPSLVIIVVDSETTPPVDPDYPEQKGKQSFPS